MRPSGFTRGVPRGARALLAALALLGASFRDARATQPPEEGALFTPSQIARIEEALASPVLRGLTALAGRGRTGEKSSAAGVVRVPVLPVRYANTALPPFEAESLQRQLFDGPWPTGTLTDYFAEASYGRLALTGVVAEWTPLAREDAYYEGPPGCFGLGDCGKVNDLVAEGVAGADAALDFGLFDNDGPDGLPNSGDDDGYVDVIAFVHPERSASCGGGSNVWAHRSALTARGLPGGIETADERTGGGRIRVDDYAIVGGVSCRGPGMIEIGVFAHELGHALGLPDLYGASGVTGGVGRWDVMGSGSSGGDGGSPQAPVHPSAWSKERLGWLAPAVLRGGATRAALPAVERAPAAVKIPLDNRADPREYLLVEHRRRIGFDGTLPGEGLLVWRVDMGVWGGGATFTGSACVDGPGLALCGAEHPGLALLQADGRFDLERRANRGDAGDPFGPGASLTPDTTPWSRDYRDAARALPSIGSLAPAGEAMAFDLAFSRPAHAACADADADGFANCDGDCAEDDALAHPGAEERCNLRDDDCDGEIDEGCRGCLDLDEDGWTDCDGDCDDANASVHPGAEERCNLRDDDCGGGTDEGCGRCLDLDEDGRTDCDGDCDDANAAVRPDAPERCNGFDDDCDGRVDENYADRDGDGVALCLDCDDRDAFVHPGAEEFCNGVDEDCDGAVDEDCDPSACIGDDCVVATLACATSRRAPADLLSGFAVLIPLAFSALLKRVGRGRRPA